jgi:hypothetical protein
MTKILPVLGHSGIFMETKIEVNTTWERKCGQNLPGYFKEYYPANGANAQMVIM